MKKRITVALSLVLGPTLLGAGCAGVPVPAPRVSAERQGDAVSLRWVHASPLATELVIERRGPGERYARLVAVDGEASEYLDRSPIPGASYRMLAFTHGQPWNGTYSAETVVK